MKQMRLGQFDHASGYTLLEVVVSFAILAMILAVTGGSVSFGARAWEQSSQQAERTGDVLLVQRLLGNWLEHVKLEGPSTAAGDAIGFEGTIEGFRTTIADPSHVLPSGDYDVAVEIVQLAGKSVLLLRQRRLGTIGESEEWQHHTLIETGLVLKFDYWGSSEIGGAWRRTWTGPDAPALVRLRMVSPDSTRAWTDIIVPVMALESRHHVFAG